MARQAQLQTGSVDRRHFENWHNGVVVELSRQLENHVGQNTLGTEGESDLEREMLADIDRSIKAIETAGATFDILNDNIRSQEQTIRELKKSLAEAKSHQEAAYNQAAKAQITLRIESERFRAKSRHRLIPGSAFASARHLPSSARWSFVGLLRDAVVSCVAPLHRRTILMPGDGQT